MSAAEEPVFKPFPFFTGCHIQTVAASFLTFSRYLESVKRIVYLADGESITYQTSTPAHWKSTDPTVVMIHGLCGSHRSAYLVRLAKKLDKRGIRTIRINLRGCGSGKGLARKMYHTGCSDDVWAAIKKIKSEAPDSPLTVMGFSFGGNVVLKMAGEWADESKELIDKVIAINPPIDLFASVKLLSKNRVYERYFMSQIRSDVLFRHRHFNDLPPIAIPFNMTLLEFDEFYIAPQSGYLTAHDYYHASSSGRIIPSIEVTTHLLFAKDDPIVDCNVMENVKVPDHVNIIVTDQGGHLGYLGTPGQEGGFHWMDSLILQWIFQ